MSIQEANDKFFKSLIEYYRSIGDFESARQNEEFYKILKSKRNHMKEDNKRIVNELTYKE